MLVLNIIYVKITGTSLNCHANVPEHYMSQDVRVQQTLQVVLILEIFTA